MKIELYHDILASKVFEKATAEEKMRLKVERFVRERYNFYLESLSDNKERELETKYPFLTSLRPITNRLNIFSKKPALLVKNDLEYVDPFLDQLLLSDEQLEFIKDSRRKVSMNSRQRITVLTLLIMSIVMTLFALVESKKAQKERENNEFLDFVYTLSRAEAISQDVLLSRQFQDLKNEIEGDNRINSNERVLEFLAQNDVLSFKDEPPPWEEEARSRLGRTLQGVGRFFSGLFRGAAVDNRHPHTRWSERALLLIDRLSANLTYTEQVAASVQEIIALEKLAGAFNDTTRSRYQFPYIYYGLHEHLKVLRAELRSRYQPTDRSAEELNNYNKNIAKHEVMIHANNARITAVASNPVQVDQYAYADVIGRVFVYSVNPEHGTLQQAECLPLDERITALTYSDDGNILYVGTQAGKLYQYEGLTQPIGRALETVLLSVSPVGPLRFLTTTAKADVLLVGGDDFLELWSRSGAGSFSRKQRLNSAAIQQLKMINTVVRDTSGEVFIAGGVDNSVILSVNLNTMAFNTHDLFHPGITVSAAAIGVTTADYPGQAVALGTETGEIWLTTMDRLLTLEEGRMDNLQMSSMHGLQDASITGLMFNQSDIPQLISSSLDGSVWMFNLCQIPYGQHIYPLAEHRNHYTQIWYDHLKLRSTDGSAISKICLKNEDNLLVVENNAIRKWPTNIGRMRSELSILLNDLQTVSRISY